MIFSTASTETSAYLLKPCYKLYIKNNVSYVLKNITRYKMQKKKKDKNEGK